MLTAILAAALRIISNPVLNALQKNLCKTSSAYNTNFKTYFLLALFCLPLFFVFYFKTLNPQIILWALIGGLFGAIGNRFLISALNCGELSVLGPINSYKPVAALVFGIIVLGEIPNFQAILGIFLIIFGSYFIFEKTNGIFLFSLFKRKDLRFRFLALVFSAVEAVFIKKVIILTDIYCSFYLWAIFGCVFSYILLKSNNETAFYNIFNFKKEISPFALLAFLVFVMQFSTNVVFDKIPLAPALSLFQLSNIINIFLGYKFFKEKNILKKLLGAIIMIIGSCLIILFEN